MTDQNNGGGGDQEAGSREGVTIPEHQAHEDRNPESSDREKRLREQRWQRRFAIYSLVFDGIVAVSAIVGGYFIWRQLNLMHDSNVNTVKANEQILGEMQRTNALTSDALAQGEEQFGIAFQQGQQQFEASLAQGRTDAAAEQGLTRQSNELSRQAMVLSQRAWVTIEDIEEGPLPSANTIIKVDFVLKNTGNTPALRTKGEFYSQLRTHQLPEDYWSPPPDLPPIIAVSVIAPGEIQECRLYGQPISEERMKEIRDGTLKWYILGRVSYEDVFGNRRRTSIATRYNIIDGTWDVPKHGNWME